MRVPLNLHCRKPFRDQTNAAHIRKAPPRQLRSDGTYLDRLPSFRQDELTKHSGVANRLVQEVALRVMGRRCSRRLSTRRLVPTPGNQPLRHTCAQSIYAIATQWVRATGLRDGFLCRRGRLASQVTAGNQFTVLTATADGSVKCRQLLAQSIECSQARRWQITGRNLQIHTYR
jgi:hypothetical protein